MRETQFKKGQLSRNYLPVGTVRADSEGYLRIKIADGLGGTGNQKVWAFVHLRTWTAAHGPVPPGHAVAFRDGNKAHTAIENLELLSRADLMRRNSIHNRRSPELRETIYGLIAVKRWITMREKKRAKKQAQRFA